MDLCAKKCYLKCFWNNDVDIKDDRVNWKQYSCSWKAVCGMLDFCIKSRIIIKKIGVRNLD